MSSDDETHYQICLSLHQLKATNMSECICKDHSSIMSIYAKPKSALMTNPKVKPYY